jgi:hypothetical protein
MALAMNEFPHWVEQHQMQRNNFDLDNKSVQIYQLNVQYYQKKISPWQTRGHNIDTAIPDHNINGT